MKKVLSTIIVAGGLIVLAGAATAHWVGGPGAGGWGRMGHGMRGEGEMGWRGGGYDCHGLETTTTAQITEDKAKELAQTYVEKYLEGYKVERVLPFTGMHHTMYSVELKNEAGELRTFHINPFGNIMPFGGPWHGRS
ncbi:MAG: hypothetical protein V3U06_05915 [Candidatus Binatia bacterium]